MGNKHTKLIQAWFLEHDGDGEFLIGPREFPYSVIGAIHTGQPIIFTTKPQIVSLIMQEPNAPARYGMVGRYGLPSKTDLDWIRRVIAHQPLLFLGDMDPVDLMAFVWLRANLCLKHLTYLGINDAFLKALEFRSTKSLSSPCAPAERESLPLLEKVFPDLRKTVGLKCAEMLDRGYKIELDVIMRKKKQFADALRSYPKTAG
jgi:hypothetical protein